MQYIDFVVKVGPHRKYDTVVQVVSSPAGQAVSTFTQPFQGITRRSLLLDLARAFSHSGADRNLLTAGVDDPALVSPQKVGEELFSCLFTGPVLSCFDQSIGGLGSQYSGLRLKLRFDLSDPESADLSRFPWELLARPGEPPLALCRRTPVVRYLEIPKPAPPLPLPNPLRLLIVVAEHGSPLDLNCERRNLEAALGAISKVAVDVERAHLASVRRALLRQQYHVLHYMGHGLLDRFTGTGILPFSNDDGTVHPVNGELLATHLRDTGLQLTFLNACNTARACSQAGDNPYSDIASALVSRGMPAVLAMQLPIPDQAAVEFSTAFYRSLAAGDPIDAATCEGRLAIRRGRHPDVWGTPVLYLRVDDGRIFLPEFEMPEPTKAARAEPSPKTEGNTHPPRSTQRLGRQRIVLIATVLVLAISACLLVLVGRPGSGSRAYDTLHGADPTGQDGTKSTVAQVSIVEKRRAISGTLGNIKAEPEPVAELAHPAGQDVSILTDQEPNNQRFSCEPSAGISIMASEIAPYSAQEDGCIPANRCCRTCFTGKACGDSCIRNGYTCRQPPGCACNSWDICGRSVVDTDISPTALDLETALVTADRF